LKAAKPSPPHSASFHMRSTVPSPTLRVGGKSSAADRSSPARRPPRLPCAHVSHARRITA
jgi:hypothetical protein